MSKKASQKPTQPPKEPPTHGDRKSAKLDEITKQFFRRLHFFYELASTRLKTTDRPRWLKTYLVFCALESTRGILGAKSGDVLCSFSLGKRKATEAELDKFLSDERTFQRSDAIRPDSMSEYLVDFSFTQMRREATIDGNVGADSPRFKLLLAAESELTSDMRKVLEDCLKLVCVTAPIKILLFPVCATEQANERWRQALEDMINRCDSDLIKMSEWLFLGIPTFDDWIRSGENVAELVHKVYRAERADNVGKFKLQEKSDWLK